MIKKLGLALVFLAVLVLLIGGMLYWQRNSLAQVALQKVLRHVFQVEATVESVDVDLAAGSITVGRLELPNPEDYGDGNAFAVDQIQATADIASFRSDLIRIESILVQGPEVALVYRKQKSNLQELIDRANRLAGEPGPDETASKPVTIDKVEIRDGHLSVSWPALGGIPLGTRLPTITMRDIGGKDEDESNTTVAGAFGKIFDKILEQGMASSVKEWPDKMSGVLAGSVDKAGELANDAGSKVGGVLKDSGSKLNEGAGKAGEGIRQGIGKIGSMLGSDDE